jgi:hypothetical protein
MKMRFTFAVIGLILVTGLVVAVERNLPAVESVEEVAEKPESPEAPKLTKIVDLCAQEQDAKFEKEWSQYVAQNDLSGDELQKTITWVSDEAAMQRKKNKHLYKDDIDEEAWKAKRRELMNKYAQRAKLL